MLLFVAKISHGCAGKPGSPFGLKVQEKNEVLNNFIYFCTFLNE